MTNLQELYDFYLLTKPSRGKVKSATTLLIHTCKALNKASPEEVTDKLFAEIPDAINEFFYTERHKAVLDKSILAEMIGRYGPKDGWQEPFNVLLNDSDENLRQFTLYSLEYSGSIDSSLVVPYIDKFRSSSDPLMQQIAAHLASKLLCGEETGKMKLSVEGWINNGEKLFVEEISKCLLGFVERRTRVSSGSECEVAYNWLQKKMET